MGKPTERRNIDDLIQSLGGCGTFQIVVVVVAFYTRTWGSASMVMMSFGNYDPGWLCADDATNQSVTLRSWPNDVTNGSLVPTTPAKGGGVNFTDKCALYEACESVRFTPGTYTTVSEWELLCDQSKFLSIIISIQMLGVLIGSYLSGYLSDKFGRKRTTCVSIVYHFIVNIVAIFSNSWQMFAVMRFLIGLAIPLLMFPPTVLALEFVSQRWRNAMFCLPTFSVGCISTALVALITKDWKYLHGVIGVVSLTSLLPFYWMPESLRWLVVKEKNREAEDLVKSIARYNGKDSGGYVSALENIEKLSDGQQRGYSCVYLLRKGFRYTTFVIGFSCMSMSLIYYAISFGIKSLPGDFYTNLILIFATDFPAALLSTVLPNYIGRKASVILFLVSATLCLFAVVGLDQLAGGTTKDVGILILAILVRSVGGCAWDVLVTYTGEVFPTVVRSTAIAMGSLMARVGGIMAPYLIPDSPDAYFINYLVMALLALVCCALMVFTHETRGRPLKDLWEDDGPGEPRQMALEVETDVTSDGKDADGRAIA